MSSSVSFHPRVRACVCVSVFVCMRERSFLFHLMRKLRPRGSEIARECPAHAPRLLQETPLAQRLCLTWSKPHTASAASPWFHPGSFPNPMTTPLGLHPRILPLAQPGAHSWPLLRPRTFPFWYLRHRSPGASPSSPHQGCTKPVIRNPSYPTAGPS